MCRFQPCYSCNLLSQVRRCDQCLYATRTVWVAWYSPFSWLWNNPHYNTLQAFLSHTHSCTHRQYVFCTYTLLLPWSAALRSAEESLSARVGKHVKNRQELFFSSSVSGVFISRTSTCFGYVQVLCATLSALLLSRCVIYSSLPDEELSVHVLCVVVMLIYVRRV